MEKQAVQKRTLIMNVLHFLTTELNAGDISDEKKALLNVAIQSLTEGYRISDEHWHNFTKIDFMQKIRCLEQGFTEEQFTAGEHHNNLGNQAMDNGNFDRAVIEFSKAIEFNPTNASYFCNRAVAFSRLENDQEAVKDSKQAIILDPLNSKAYGTLGEAYLNLGNLREAEEAMNACDKALNDPQNSNFQAHFRYAQEQASGSMGRELRAAPALQNIPEHARANQMPNYEDLQRQFGPHPRNPRRDDGAWGDY